MSFYGYGQILDIDLSSGNIIPRDITPRFARQYIGGMGFSCKILYDEVGPEVDAFSPDNIVVFANGPLTGTHAPCAGRTEITTKSPLTGIIGTGNTGGMWGTMLKRAGFDVIVVRGEAAKPVYLWIDDAVVEVRPASHLWGKDTRTTTDLLYTELGGPAKSGVSVMAIGPAGENLVRYACPLNDYHHAAARGGAGAVMGAKKLKAIAVRGSGTVNVARPEAFRAAAREARERLMTAYRAGSKFATEHEGRQGFIERGCLPARNFQTGVLPDFIETRGIKAARKYVTRQEGTCYACPISCFNLAEVHEGKYSGLTASRATHPGVVFEWGAKCAIDNLPAIWKCKETCQQLGLDYVSASGVIAFAMELWQRGIITTRDTDGLELYWGNDDAALAMLHKIALRNGFGDVLAEGSVRAAARIGRGAEKYVMAVKGMEQMSADPRAGRRGWVFGDLTNPRGGDNVKGTHFQADHYNPDWWVDKFDMPEDIKKKIYDLSAEEVADTWAGKPLLCRWFEDLTSLLNSLGLCFFPSSTNLALGPSHLAKLWSACTGWDTTPEEIMAAGERVFNLFKAYSVRQGLTRKDDTWPDRFFTESLPEGPSRGAVLSRDEIERRLDEYYELRGWGLETGIPGRATLERLGLKQVADDLEQKYGLPVPP